MTDDEALAELVAAMRRDEKEKVHTRGWQLACSYYADKIDALRARQPEAVPNVYDYMEQKVAKELRPLKELRPAPAAVEEESIEERLEHYVALVEAFQRKMRNVGPLTPPEDVAITGLIGAARAALSQQPGVPEPICPNCERPTEIRHCQACGCDFTCSPPPHDSEKGQTT